MQTIILLITISLLGALTIKCMKREDELIELEDRIVEEIRAFLRGGKKSKKPAKIEKTVHKADNAHGRAA